MNPQTRLNRLWPIIGAILALTIVLWPLTPGVAAAPAVQTDRFATIESEITALMALYDVPGAGIAIVQDGKIAYTRGFGVRDTKTGAKVDNQTAFAIGSVTKSMTTLGIELLAAEGKVDLDKPVITYLPDLKLSDESAQKSITLRQLLSHTSGLSPLDTGSQVLVAAEVSRAEYLKAIESIPLISLPGTSFRYANQNFVLAGLVIEKVTGQRWEDFTRERIFKPLGMANTGFDAADLMKNTNAAAPHDLDVIQGMVPVAYTQNLSAIGPAASVNASAEDMARYALFQLTGQSPDGQIKLPKALLDQMHTPVIALTADVAADVAASASTPTPAATQPATPAADKTPLVTETKYALGWFTETYRGLTLVQHGGNVVGYSSNITLVPAQGIGVVVLTDANYANLFVDVARLRLVEIAAGLPSERDLAKAMNTLSGYDPEGLKARLEQARTFKADPADLEKLTGEYTGSNGKTTITAKDGKLYALAALTGIAVEMIPYVKDGFLGNTFPYRGNRFTFVTDSNGTQIVMGQPGSGITFGFRPAAGQVTKTISGKDKLYSVDVPSAFVVQSLLNFEIAIQPAPQLIVVTAVYPIVNENPLDDLDVQNRTLDPTFKDKPISTRTITLNGVEWIEYEYAAPSGQVSLSYVTRKGKNNYYFGYATAKSELENLQPVIDGIFKSFVINED